MTASPNTSRQDSCSWAEQVKRELDRSMQREGQLRAAWRSDRLHRLGLSDIAAPTISQPRRQSEA